MASPAPCALHRGLLRERRSRGGGVASRGEYSTRRLLKQGFALFLLSFWLPLSDSQSSPTVGDLKTTKVNPRTAPPCLSQPQDLGTYDAVFCCMVGSKQEIN